MDKKGIVKQDSKDPNKVLLIINGKDNHEIAFYLRVELINRLVIEEQKNIDVHIMLREGETEIIPFDFSDLKPAFNRPIIKKKLVSSFSVEDPDDTDEYLKFGLSKKDKNTRLWLSKAGWVREKKIYNAMIKDMENLTVERTKSCINPACSENIKFNAKFCPFCGSKQEEEIEKKKCNNCNKEIKQTASFCPFCGTKQ